MPKDNGHRSVTIDAEVQAAMDTLKQLVRAKLKAEGQELKTVVIGFHTDVGMNHYLDGCSCAACIRLISGSLQHALEMFGSDDAEKAARYH